MSTAITAWSKANKIGLVLLAIYGAANLVPPPPMKPGEPGPPMFVIVGDMILGVLMVGLVVVAWRKGSKPAAWLACAAAALAALSAIPAFFVAGIPTFIQAVVAFFTVFAIVAIALTLRPAKSA